MDMAERDDTEGQCPACGKPYDKEKIVGMATNCERLVAEINSESKLKSQKVKAKTLEGRKHLSSLRVIQQNLAYIIGIPSNLADEDLLQRKEYFGQYGKVLKVSISRTAGGAIQHSSNNTCSVYITYSKEEEVVRCIRYVHGYVLEGRSLRACFGTTKYCHAWLRNTPCTNPDCLYLHDIGTQEDSFTKDEIISAYTRSRIPQINGTPNNLHQRSGNVLPSPLDDICNSGAISSGKSRAALNNAVSQEKGASPNGNSGKSITLPAGASWGLRTTNGQPPTAPSTCSNGPAKQNPDAFSEQSQLVHGNSGLGDPEQFTVRDSCAISLDESKDDTQGAVSDTVTVGNRLSGLPVSKDIDDGIKFLSSITRSLEFDRQSHNSTSDKDGIVLMNGKIQSLCSGSSSFHIDSHICAPSNANECNGSTTDHYLSGSIRNQGLKQSHPQYAIEPLYLPQSRTAALDGACTSMEFSEWGSESQMQGSSNVCGELGEDSLTVGKRSLNVSEISHPSHSPNASDSLRRGNHSGTFSWQCINARSVSNPDSRDLVPAHRKSDGALLPLTSLLSYENSENKISNHFDWDNAFSSLEEDKNLGRFSEHSAALEGHTAVELGESRIISNVLSLDLDPWNESLALPNHLAKILSETDTQHGSLKLSGPWKLQNSDQSRFSFARQEDFVNQETDFDPLSNVGHMINKYSSPHDYVQNRDIFLDKLQNSFSSNILEDADTYPDSNSVISSNKFSVSRAQISAPPGFSAPSRAPPPGFSAAERMDQSCVSVNQLLESSLLRNQYQMHLTGDQDSIDDVELIDPAILAVGRGGVENKMNNSSFNMRSAFNSQLSASESDRRLQLLMQQSISALQNHRYFDNIGDMLSPHTDPYNMSSRLLEQSPFGQLPLQPGNLHIPNSWDSWHETQSGNDMVRAVLLKNERIVPNKIFPG